MTYGRILFGTDGSPAAARAGGVAAALAAAQGAKLTIMSAYLDPRGIDELLAEATEAAQAFGLRATRIDTVKAGRDRRPRRSPRSPSSATSG